MAPHDGAVLDAADTARPHGGSSHRDRSITAIDTSTQALAADAAAAVALLERFGALLAEALDAAGSGAVDAFDAAVAERARVMAALEPLLASLAAARRSARTARGLGEGRAGRAQRNAAVARILRPVDAALENARLLHARLTDEGAHPAPMALVR